MGPRDRSSPTGAEVDEEPTNILVVDDLPEKLLVYRTILDELGQNLIVARSRARSASHGLQHDFAVILLDVQMPGMSGLETAALIRRRKRSAHTPIIFLTAFADEVRVAEGYAQGAVDYITTPVVPAILRQGARVLRPVPDDPAGSPAGGGADRTGRGAIEARGRRGGQPRLAFLTCAGEVLGQSLDQEVTARDVVHLPLPLLADEARGWRFSGPIASSRDRTRRDGERKMVASKTCLRKPPSIRLSSKRLVGAWPVHRPPRWRIR